MAKYTFEPKEPMSAYQLKVLVLFLFELLKVKEVDDTIDPIPLEIKKHFKEV